MYNVGVTSEAPRKFVRKALTLLTQNTCESGGVWVQDTDEAIYGRLPPRRTNVLVVKRSWCSYNTENVAVNVCSIFSRLRILPNLRFADSSSVDACPPLFPVAILPV